ncbi:MAG: SDR family oxidoreductase [Arenicellales bacterium]|jgi:uncharacterized protein YbjT (DUF2867 family)|nr:SDR family oxidoreductase [Arenicellales bacterium]
MTTLIIGANGKIGQLVCQQGSALGMDLLGMVRNTEQAPNLEKLGARTVVADLEGEFSHAFDGVSMVVFTAGSGGHTGADKTLMVDLYGAVRAIAESERQGIDHFVMVSALDADHPLSHFPQIAPYMVAKKAADDYLRASKVPYTVLRPGRLTDDPGSGEVSTTFETTGPKVISRENVSGCILAALASVPEAQGRVLDLVDGDQPIKALFT